MARHQLLALLLVTATAVSGCGLVEPSNIAVAAPTIVCDPVRIDPPPTLQCEAAVLAALEQIGHSGVVAMASFHHGAPCAPNMRCAFGVNRGYVVLRLVDGRCAFVEVAVEPGEASAPQLWTSALETWPPQEWQGMGVNPPVECQ